MAATPDDARLSDPRLGKAFRLEGRMLGGTLGTVWRGVDTRSGEPVAARVLAPAEVTDRSALRRTLRAGSPLRELRDPHLVAIRDLVEERHRTAVVTDFMDAGSLAEVLRSEGPLPPKTAVALVAGVLSGLAALHGAGLVHGAVRAQNVLLPSYWRRLTPGSARLADPVLPGLGGPAAATPADDVRAAGALLYELLTGRAPAGEGRPATLDVPPRLWNALAGMLAPEPALRPGAAAAAEALAGLVDSLAGLRPLGPVPGSRPGRPAASRVGAARYLPAADLTGPAPRLGDPVEHTMVRPDAVPVPVAEEVPAVVATPWYRRAWVWAAVVGMLLVVAAVVWVILGRPGL